MKLENATSQKTLIQAFPLEKEVTMDMVRGDSSEHYINSISRDLFAEDDIGNNETNKMIMRHAKTDGGLIEQHYEEQQQQLSTSGLNNVLTGQPADTLSAILDKQITSKSKVDKDSVEGDLGTPIFSLGGGYTIRFNSKFKNVQLSRYFSSTRAKIGRYEKYQMGIPINALPILTLVCLELMKTLPDFTELYTYRLARNTTCKSIDDVHDYLSADTTGSKEFDNQPAQPAPTLFHRKQREQSVPEEVKRPRLNI